MLHDSFCQNWQTQDSRALATQEWEQHEWSNWELPTAPSEMPIWRYTATALGSGDTGSSYYPSESPISSYSNIPASQPSATSSPLIHIPDDQSFGSPPHATEKLSRPLKRSIAQFLYHRETSEGDELDEDEDVGSWEPKIPMGDGIKSSSRPSHKRARSSNEVLTRDAKRAHTVVERNYRERLNDKIADLGLYLFETSSDARTKPSKSLVMTRAKERLQQLELRNKMLEEQVVELRQQIAILDHINASKGDLGRPVFQ